jgi:alanyl-tRNA synthetase
LGLGILDRGVKLDKDRLYVSVFEGNEENVPFDQAFDIWKQFVSDRIILGNKKR